MELKCKNHPDREAAGKCVACGEPFCRDCLTEVDGIYYCAAHDPRRQNVLPADEEAEKHPEPPVKCYSIYVGLALLLGPAGAHFFYSGSTGSGVAMLLVSALIFVIGRSAGHEAVPLIIMWIVSAFQAFVFTTDGYGRPMV